MFQEEQIPSTIITNIYTVQENKCIILHFWGEKQKYHIYSPEWLTAHDLLSYSLEFPHEGQRLTTSISKYFVYPRLLGLGYWLPCVRSKDMADAQASGGDKILREAVRQNLDKWLQKLDCSGDVEKKLAFKMKFVEKLRESPVAVETARANEQHYEVPTDFFRTVSF